MTDYLREARNAYSRAEMTDAETVQSAALIAIAEALRPASSEARIRDEERQHWVGVAERAIEDRDRAEKELAELREVIRGGDHTAAKYYRRMQAAEKRATEAESEIRANALRDAATAARSMHDPPANDCLEWADWLDARAEFNR